MFYSYSFYKEVDSFTGESKVKVYFRRKLLGFIPINRKLIGKFDSMTVSILQARLHFHGSEIERLKKMAGENSSVPCKCHGSGCCRELAKEQLAAIDKHELGIGETLNTLEYIESVINEKEECLMNMKY